MVSYEYIYSILEFLTGVPEYSCNCTRSLYHDKHKDATLAVVWEQFIILLVY